MIFMQLSTNPIAVCDLASPGPPHLKQIWGPKSLPVSYFFHARKTCNFYEIYATFNKPYRRILYYYTTILLYYYTCKPPHGSRNQFNFCFLFCRFAIWFSCFHVFICPILPMYENVRKCTEMHENVRECTKMYENVRKCTKIYENIRKC